MAVGGWALGRRWRPRRQGLEERESRTKRVQSQRCTQFHRLEAGYWLVSNRGARSLRNAEIPGPLPFALGTTPHDSPGCRLAEPTASVYPRFLLNVSNDDVLWLEEFSQEDQNELEKVTQALIEEALAFFDREIEAME